jgi:hypothetical protein
MGAEQDCADAGSWVVHARLACWGRSVGAIDMTLYYLLWSHTRDSPHKGKLFHKQRRHQQLFNCSKS